MGCKPSSGANTAPVNVILLGPPGCGKGTQAENVRDSLKLKWISTGDLLRAEKAAGTELGKKAGEIMALGQLVPDEMIIELIVKEFPPAGDASCRGLLLDGFPRTTNQA